jgi:hypothetical protein
VLVSTANVAGAPGAGDFRYCAEGWLDIFNGTTKTGCVEVWTFMPLSLCMLPPCCVGLEELLEPDDEELLEPDDDELLLPDDEELLEPDDDELLLPDAEEFICSPARVS